MSAQETIPLAAGKDYIDPLPIIVDFLNDLRFTMTFAIKKILGCRPGSHTPSLRNCRYYHSFLDCGPMNGGTDLQVLNDCIDLLFALIENDCIRRRGGTRPRKVVQHSLFVLIVLSSGQLQLTDQMRALFRRNVFRRGPQCIVYFALWH